MLAVAGALGLAIADAKADLSADTVKTIAAALERNHVLSQAQLRCVSFMLESETSSVIEVEVRESHGRGCPGDPETAPRMFNVRYMKQTRAILKEKPMMDGYDRLR